MPSPHMVQVLENKKQNEASCFYLGKHVPESCPQKIRSCVLIRTSCYFSRCQVNVCLQEKSFRGACICSLGLLGQVLQTGVGGRTQQERVSSRELGQASEISSASPRSPPPHHLLHLHTHGLSFLLCLSWPKCPLLLKSPVVCVSVHPVASFKVSSLETLIPDTVTLRDDRPQEERLGSSGGCWGRGWAAFPGTEAHDPALAGRGQTCSGVGGLTWAFLTHELSASSGHPLCVSRCLCPDRPPLGYNLHQAE